VQRDERHELDGVDDHPHDDPRMKRRDEQRQRVPDAADDGAAAA
jgi:hypothetical protein